MGSLVKFLKETYKKQSLLEAVKAGGWKAALDGNLAQTTLVHGPGATFMGEDENGNKYYERMTEQHGRHRWVVYGNLNWPDGQEPTSIPAEWHGWINHITDASPKTANLPKPIYAIAHKPLKMKTYAPKGAWKNPHKRNWTKVQTWQPPSA